MAYQWKEQLDRLMKKGASYADVRYYPKDDSLSMAMLNGNMHSFTQEKESGFGVRVLADGAWGFAASSVLDDITGTFDKALSNARTAAKRMTRPVRLADKEVLSGSFSSPCRQDALLVPLDEQAAFLQKMDAALKQPGVTQRVAYLIAMSRTVEYYDSEGAEIHKEIRELFPSIFVKGRDVGGETQGRKYSPPRLGDSRGWEIMQEAHWLAEAERIVRELNETLVAPRCPRDVRSVILMPDQMYLQVHETIGHPLELDRILGYELSYAGGSFVRLEDFGSLQYGTDKLNVRADALLPNSPGSFGYDDDGVAAQNYMLIERGVLVGAITSRQMVTEANERAGRNIFSGSGGTARATAFYRTPLERMTNISVDPGQDGSLKDIIASTEKGIVLSGDKSWSIGSNREQFHFANDYAYLVEDGQVKNVVRSAAYSGDTLPFYNSLSAVGDESTWQVQYVPNCGKGMPSQIMQLGHGVPVCRFDHVKVGE
ncbi:MAG: TldD/PmbA family protein [Christensenellales bacterium]|jgi:TldD protein